LHDPAREVFGIAEQTLHCFHRDCR
jgi:hypothetical protein